MSRRSSASASSSWLIGDPFPWGNCGAAQRTGILAAIITPGKQHDLLLHPLYTDAEENPFAMPGHSTYSWATTEQAAETRMIAAEGILNDLKPQSAADKHLEHG